MGQKPVVRTLQNALAQNRVPHALIFSGVRGTGKTTLARIMAKALNCELGPAAEPCNGCRSCNAITEGVNVDLQEVDGASHRGIQEIRELKEKIRFLPTNSRFKIIIIDEVHMLTTEAFNALLKTLEEPPSHVYFIFATTELHKVPVTILSRCQRYELKRISHQDLTAHFLRLADKEGVQVEPEAMKMIVREAGGSVRDGLSLLDQIFSYCGANVLASDVVEVLGLVSHQLVADVGAALLRGDLAAIYSMLDKMYAHGSDSRRFSNDLLAWFRGLVVCKVSLNPGQLLAVSEDELRELSAAAAEHSLETLTALFNLLFDGLEKATFAQQPRLALELVCIRAVQFRDVVPVADLIARFDQVLEGAPDKAAPAEAQAPAIRPGQQTDAEHSSAYHPQSDGADRIGMQARKATDQTEPEPLPTPQEQTHSTPVRPDDTQTRTSVAHPEPPVPPTTHSSVAQPDRMVEPSLPPEPNKKLFQQQDDFCKYVRERQPWMAASLQMAESIERQNEELIIRFGDSSDCALLKQRTAINDLTGFILEFFQENMRIRLESPDSGVCSADPANGSTHLQERRALANDPLVLTALDVFTGQIADIRVGQNCQTVSSPPSPRQPDDRNHSTTEEE